MEKDDEVSGNENTYTTFHRAYDPRLGRWLSLDPVHRPNASMYVGFSNNPIIKVDPRGDDDFFDTKGKYLGSTAEGSQIKVFNSSKAEFNQIINTNSNFVKVLESKSAPFESFNFNYVKNNNMAAGVMSHYFNMQQFTDKDGNLTKGENSVGGTRVMSYNAYTYTKDPDDPVSMEGGLGAIYLGKNSAGKIPSYYGNKYSLINVLIHEDKHLHGGAAGDENYASHLTAFWAELGDESWNKMDAGYRDQQTKVMGGYLYYAPEQRAKFEKKLGVKFTYDKEKMDKGEQGWVGYEKTGDVK
jgi:RHS repeat-associated protein